MAERSTESRIKEIADQAAATARAEFMRRFEFVKGRCQSPIEQILLASMMAELGGFDRMGYGVWWTNSDHVWRSENSFEPPGAHVYLQANVGRFRADFLFAVLTDERWRYLVIECDGHDYHDRTKEQAARDKARDRWMVAQGITVLRFTGSEIWANPSKCAIEVRDAVDRMACNTENEAE